MQLAFPTSSKAYFAYLYFKSLDNIQGSYGESSWEGREFLPPRQNQSDVILSYGDEESAVSAYNFLKIIASEDAIADIIFLPSFDTVPYDRVSPSSYILSSRASVFACLSTIDRRAKLIVTNAKNLVQKIPPKEHLQNSTLDIKQNSQISMQQICKFLIENSFVRSPVAIDAGEFAVRGEILDIVLDCSAGNKLIDINGLELAKVNDNIGCRINFAFDNIENIKIFDLASQISGVSIGEVRIQTASESMLSPDNIQCFKKNFLSRFGVNHTSSKLYETISNGNKFPGYEYLTPFLYGDMQILTDYLKHPVIIYDNYSWQNLQQYIESFDEFFQAREESNSFSPGSFYYGAKPDELVATIDVAREFIHHNNNIEITGEAENKFWQNGLNFAALEINKEHKTAFDQMIDHLFENRNKTALVFCQSQGQAANIEKLASLREVTCKIISKLPDAKKNVINIIIAPLTHGFITEKYIFIAQQDIFGSRFVGGNFKSNKRRLKQILTEADAIEEGQLVVHRDLGIGRFENVETITANNKAHDCLKIIYDGGDILYLPVEHIDLIKKYGNQLSGQDEIILDKLGSANWQKRKAKLKAKILDVADSLMKITAMRQLAVTKETNFEQQIYDKFCQDFPYSETEDQLRAIDEIRSDLASGKLMDRLVCGDVGFGKTEVAMRAALMVASDINETNPQIVLIAPTTILARQHFDNFRKRFKKFDIKIVHLSRLVTAKETKLNKQDIASGDADIIIGTHALLASNISFKNLRLIIIDEEQHFGALQKERLKEIKTGVHVLSMSATPIPRTLQMSMVGIKDLSLITTAPIDRLPVRTSIIPFDNVILRDALMREKYRGGKSFVVVPRIKDIEFVVAKLRDMVPELSFNVAHGQMAPGEIDRIMNDFCDSKFDILISTTIIESGIDIAGANTMIIYASDILGLSQLYQLRGRVGRGRVRGYAYLTLTPKKIISAHSLSRLELLQNIDTLGAGFTIASHDMDMRGFGNLVGQEQSGHIKEVGTELYQEMLDEAINDIKQNEQNNVAEKRPQIVPSINLNLAVYIPENYINDSNLRLAIYRRVADITDDETADNFLLEMIDRFGPIPIEFENLLSIVELKNRCAKLGIINLDAGPGGFVFKFIQGELVHNMVLSFVALYPRFAKIKPENKMVYVTKTDPKTIISAARKILIELAQQVF